MPILLLLACVFGAPAGDDSTTRRPDAADEGDTEEAAKGSVVRIVTVDVAIAEGAEFEVDGPDNGTFLRVDSCYEDAEVVCDVWAGGYRAYGDGSVTLTPSVWDGSLARVTYLVIE